MDNYVIYSHINKINQKRYIGQTKQTLSRRFRKDGKGYIHCVKFYNAIQKYGWDNFDHEILKENLTQEEANYWEKYYIDFFDSIANGYNMKEGGITAFDSKIISEENKKRWEKGIYNNIKTAVYCIELDLEFESALEAERKLNIDNSAIQKACKGKIKYSGFSKEGRPLHWIYIKDKTDEKIQELKNRKEIIKGIKIPVYCPELDKVFSGTDEVYQELGIDPSSIRKVIRGKNKTAGKHPITNEKLHWVQRMDLINTKNKLNE